MIYIKEEISNLESSWSSLQLIMVQNGKKQPDKKENQDCMFRTR
jgi:hypothetical protein